MLDLLLLAVLGLLFARGWMRGLIREAVSLAVIIVGTFFALRLNGAVGGIIESLLGFSSSISRIVAGILIFLAISIGAGLAIRMLQLGVRMLPGVTTLNRLGGAVFSAGAGLIVITLILSVVAAVNPSESITNRLEDSAIAGYLIDEDALPQGVLGVLAGDRILATTIRLQSLFGEANVVATDAVVALPLTDPDDVRQNNTAPDRIADRANRLRVRADVDPLARAPRLDRVAVERAFDIATTGEFTLLGPDGTGVQELVEAAELRFDGAIEIVLLGSTAASINDAIEADERARAVVEGDHRRIGVGVVSSTNGLVAVVIFAS
jgi:uncharacterized membrane protein required for colicin V production/uncharacterized protein YkwD